MRRIVCAVCFLYAALFLILAYPCSAQITFERIYGDSLGDVGWSVLQTADGGYVVGGYTESFGADGRDIYLLRTDSRGDVVRSWTFGWNSGSDDEAYSICQTSDGGFSVGGYVVTASSLKGCCTLKTDSLFALVGQAAIIDTEIRSVHQRVSGPWPEGAILAGIWGPAPYDVFLLMQEPGGAVGYQTHYGGGEDDMGYGVDQVLDSGFVIVGETRSYGAGGSDVYLVRTDSLNNLLWDLAIGGSDDDCGWSIQQTTDGGYIITGSTESFGAGSLDVYLVKTDSLGNLLWDRTYGGTEVDVGYSVQQTLDGGYIIAGETSSLGSGGCDVYVIKTDSVGDTVWTRTYGGISSDHGSSVQQTLDGGYIIAGYTGSFGVDSIDVYLIKTGDDGVVERDVAVVGLEAEDTVFVDSTYSVKATVQNLLPGFPSFDVTATVDGYADTVDVQYLWQDSLCEITFSDWSVPSGDTATYILTICVHAPHDTNSANDCMQKSIFAHEGLGPVILSAEASDNVNLIPGIDDDDFVVMTFDEPTNRAAVNALNINSVLALSGGHSWLDGFGDLDTTYWNPLGDMLMIELSVNLGPPTVAVGDTVTPDGTTITDEWGNRAVSSVIITGSFSPPGVEEVTRFWLPKVFALSQNRPNPFTRSTTITYSLPGHVGDESHVNLDIYDLSGRLVETLVNENQTPGIHKAYWDATDIASGIYFYRLRAGDFTDMKKMILLR
jgi:hypothetical protein